MVIHLRHPESAPSHQLVGSVGPRLPTLQQWGRQRGPGGGGFEVICQNPLGRGPASRSLGVVGPAENCTGPFLRGPLPHRIGQPSQWGSPLLAESAQAINQVLTLPKAAAAQSLPAFAPAAHALHTALHGS